jgi:hypothetical protein
MGMFYPGNGQRNELRLLADVSFDFEVHFWPLLWMRASITSSLKRERFARLMPCLS